jgi:hypothetical protein
MDETTTPGEPEKPSTPFSFSFSSEKTTPPTEPAKKFHIPFQWGKKAPPPNLPKPIVGPNDIKLGLQVKVLENRIECAKIDSNGKAGKAFATHHLP